MKSTKFIIASVLVLLSAFASRWAAPSTVQSLPSNSRATVTPMTRETAFYYFVAIYGAPDDVIDRYASYFDASNYPRAMRDEFERDRYRNDIEAKITKEVNEIDFDDQFTFVGEAMLAEYSFAQHVFPIVRVPEAVWCVDAKRSGLCRGSVLHVGVFRREEAVNAADFDWALPMPETEASAFVKSRMAGQSGGVNRSVAVKITYSVLNQKGSVAKSSLGPPPAFATFIYSAEVYADTSLSKKLGVIPKINSLAPRNPDELRKAVERAKEEAPEKLRTLLATLPILDGAYRTGYGPVKLRLRVISFDSGSGAISTEVEWSDEFTKQPGLTYRAVGSVSGDILHLTVTVADERRTDTFLWTLQLDKSTRKLAGEWHTASDAQTSPIWFDLK